ncbi:hypothetical protein TUM4438_46620 [Shewanella sairae]|uniref:Uncharacterized protein n=1 Tax=Shewanella sairae TaxID=190310 RepID=A0ABQ4NSK6_9GAMM|nr:hypothetical protein TUM4438_46620 [Shewanella sairae]
MRLNFSGRHFPTERLCCSAQNQKLNDELIEVASIILMELSDFRDIDDFATRQYMEKGASLVERVFQNQ